MPEILSVDIREDTFHIVARKTKDKDSIYVLSEEELQQRIDEATADLRNQIAMDQGTSGLIRAQLADAQAHWTCKRIVDVLGISLDDLITVNKGKTDEQA